MKKHLLLFLFTVLYCSTYGQLNPVWNTQSPEVANLGTYGQIPVSLYTGTPNISIPIYDLKVGEYNFPIKFCYHIASVKPNMQGGCLGLGWSLAAGGYITRTVRGTYDEKLGTDGIPHGYYAYATRMKNITPERFKIENDSICPPSASYPNREHDISADEFSFNFFGYSGNFYYNEDKGWTVISDQDIKVEFNEDNGFLNLSEIKKRIKIIQWAGANDQNRFFSKFTLITPDGCRYEFGGLNAMEFSIPYYGRNYGDFVATTWRISKITTPKHHSIIFTYDTSGIICDIKYVPQKKILENIECQNVVTEEIGRAGFTGHLLFSTNIKSIETPNDTLEFIYFKDPKYGEMFPPQALFWGSNSLIPNRENFFNYSQLSSSSEFGQFLGGNIRSVKDVQEKLQNNILHCIRLKNGASNRSFYFDYAFNNRRKLSKFTVRPGEPSINPDFSIPKLDSTLAIPEYRFKYYNQAVMPRSYVLCNTDSWGYYTDGTTTLTASPNYELTLPRLIGSMAETLTEITYPTKGSTKFIYENHTFSKQVSPNRQNIENISNWAGGLRISEIINTKEDGSIVKKLKYHYSHNIERDDISSGISSGRPQFIETYETENGNTKGKVILYSMAGFSNPVTNLNSPSVSYSSVIEETVDSMNNSLGYTRYRFTNYDQDMHHNAHIDEKPLYMANCKGEKYSFPYTSNSEERGKLLCKENFDKKGKLTSKTEFYYERINNKDFTIANQRCLVLCSRPQVNFSWSNMGWLTKNHQYSYFPKEEINTKYLHGDSLVTTKLLEYDEYKQLTASTEFSGTKTFNEKITEIKYPYNDNAYKWMVKKHIISPIISKTETEKEYSKTEISLYKTFNEIPFIETSKIVFNKKESKEIYWVTKTDNYGNPIEIERNGLYHILLWGNNGQDLIVHIENARYNEETKYQLGLSDSENITPSYIEANRHKLPSSHIYIYKYDNARRLISVSYPNGTTDYYSYDFLDRLREIYYYEVYNGKYIKHIKNRYDYGYK